MVKMMQRMVAVLSVALLWVGNADAVNIVSNGSFENFTGTFGNVISGDGGSRINPGEAFLTGWDVVTDEIALLQNGNLYNLTASDGTRFLDLTGYTSAGSQGISQLLSGLTIGQQYKFSVDLGIRNGDCGGAFCQGPITVSASIGSTNQTFTHDSADPGNIWKSFGFNFTANSSDLLLKILGTSGDDFIGVDNVLVEAIDTPPGPGGTAPEPSALLLFGSGLVGIAFWRRKQTA